jgi:hypothetical protein
MYRTHTDKTALAYPKRDAIKSHIVQIDEADVDDNVPSTL